MALRMLINALHPEETRVAIADEDRLIDLEVERRDSVQMKGNIYKAKITRIEPSLQAAFLDIGSTRNGFLQINDIHPSYFNAVLPVPENPRDFRGRPPIQEVLCGGQDLVVQVVKDERNLKGATLTTNLSIPGRFLVLMVGNQRGGVSRKIADEKLRRKLKDSIQQLRMPSGMSVIVRTAGMNKVSTELQRDLDALIETWNEIIQKSLDPSTPQMVYQESDLTIRTIRDYLSTDIEEILVDEKETYERVKSFINRVMPSFLPRLTFYEGSQPLFSKFHLETQIEAADHPELTLPSGGSIVINQTEAITAVDVNSGRSTGQRDVEETAFNTNREAAEEIARQLRLRDIGGLIVIDFIDMGDRRHKAVVERTLKEAVRFDKAKVELSRISKFGLLEMSRQRLKASLGSQHHTTCTNCNGIGKVKTTEAAALEALRKIESAVYAGNVRMVRARMAPAAALFLLNNKREALYTLEKNAGVSVLVYADGRMKSDQYELELDTGRVESSLPSPGSGNSPRSDHRGDSRGGDSREGDRSDDRQSRHRGGNRGGRNRDRGRRNNNRRRDNRRDYPRNDQRAGSNDNRQGGEEQREESAPAPTPPTPFES